VLTPAGAGFVDRSKTNFEFSTVGGVRYYVADNWGIRPEVRVFISGRNFTPHFRRGFYDIDADWPFPCAETANLSQRAAFAIVNKMNSWASISARVPFKDEPEADLVLACGIILTRPARGLYWERWDQRNLK
jgi:hypothetical protein